MNHPTIRNSPNPYPSVGEIIDGKYQIERILGEGGMGAVAKAMHLLRRAPVALKFMSPHVMNIAGAVERFLNEGVAASQISSDHVVHIFDVGKLPSGAPYLVMEYLEGLDLAQLIQRDGQPGLPIDRAIHFVLQTIRGLQVAHDAGIVHRDMKPSNCFIVTKDGEPDFVKLVDFGISKVQQKGAPSLTQTNSALGTPLYMSPEQAKSPRDVDLRSDIYSVGVILYELLTGRTPFNSESGEFTEILFKLFTQDPPPIANVRPDIPPALAEVVHRALAREPQDRFANAAEMGMALAPFADARSQQVLFRIKSHVSSHSQQASLPSKPPMAEFSKLGGTLTPVGSDNGSDQLNHPPAPVAPPFDARHKASFVPAGAAAVRATAEEATAATQYGGNTLDLPPASSLPFPSAPGEAPKPKAAPAPATRKISPLFFIAPLFFIFGLLGTGAWISSRKTPNSHSSPAIADTTESIPSAALPPSSTMDASAPTTLPGVTANTESPVSTASASAPSAKPLVPSRPPSGTPNTPETTRPVRLKDLKVKE